MTYQKTGIRKPESPICELVRSLKNLRAGEAEVEYKICMLQDRLVTIEREYIEGEILSANALTKDRVQGGLNTDAHDKVMRIIERIEGQGAVDQYRLVELLGQRAEYSALKMKISDLPLPYRWIITAKYIDKQKDTQICKQLKHGRTRFYHVLEEGLRLLLREIDEEGLNLFLKENYFRKSEQSEQCEQSEH